MCTASVYAPDLITAENCNNFLWNFNVLGGSHRINIVSSVFQTGKHRGSYKQWNADGPTDWDPGGSLFFTRYQLAVTLGASRSRTVTCESFIRSRLSIFSRDERGGCWLEQNRKCIKAKKQKSGFRLLEMLSLSYCMLKMEEAGSSETFSFIYQTTRRHFTEDSNLLWGECFDLKSKSTLPGEATVFRHSPVIISPAVWGTVAALWRFQASATHTHKTIHYEKRTLLHIRSQNGCASVNDTALLNKKIIKQIHKYRTR
jgi:hypothetical protein